MFNSCLVDDESNIDLNDDGFNVSGFSSSKGTVAGIADGSEYAFEFKVNVSGPTSKNLTNDVTVTFGATDASTAIEGTHYRIDTKTITLTKANNYLGKITVTMLTDGIVAPLDESPILYLKATETTGDAKVTSGGKPIEIIMNYACYSNLAGTYNCTMLRDGANPVEYVDVITETGVGEYRTSEVGHWIGGLGVGTPGYTFYDVCNVISVPGQNLVEYYGNWVEGVEPGTVDPETGVIHIVYSISSTGWSSEYDCTYVPVGK